jgi:hypothetical protein
LTHRIKSQPPGKSVPLSGTSVQVACVDEWIWVDKALIEGTYLPAAGILRLGERLYNGI